MKTVQLESRVGADGILTLRVPLGAEEANHSVAITIQSLPTDPRNLLERQHRPQDWHEFVEQTYGSCAGLEVDRADQGEAEEREPIA
jgi:hypothetical protein